ncbi:Uncharacterised protein [Burkholderia pseudomallei]|nr:Uncharacterised protein [Burkholderia pseudomallei]CAJ4275677.1 Uncharacterised protein [Burkholderia pseudomallei]
MEKAHSPEPAETSLDDTAECSKPRAHFEGTTDPRHIRILDALMARPCSREEVDRIAGASNGPHEISELRALGLDKFNCLPMRRERVIDRDGAEVHRGIYWLTERGKQAVIDWRNRTGRAA